VAVLLDATLIRVAVGPALLRLGGRWNWWPGTSVSSDTTGRHRGAAYVSGGAAETISATARAGTD
jgi:uncharacterized membrane protein YdfJ with MMPL/SSD domain